MKPYRTEYRMGNNLYGQPIVLVHCVDSSGRMVWEIHREAANQQDDQVWVGGLTREIILQMAEAVKEHV